MEKREKFFPAASGRASTCIPASITIPGGNVRTFVHTPGPMTVTNTDPVNNAKVWMTSEQTPLFWSSVAGVGLYRFIYRYEVNGVPQGDISLEFLTGLEPLKAETKVLNCRFLMDLAPGQTLTVQFFLDAQADGPGLTILGACMETNLILVHS